MFGQQAFGQQTFGQRTFGQHTFGQQTFGKISQHNFCQDSHYLFDSLILFEQMSVDKMVFDQKTWSLAINNSTFVMIKI
jgi:hypothetical protein